MISSFDKARMKRGFTLTEAAIVLGIVGLILGAIWVAAAAVYSNMRVSTANTQLMKIVQNVRTLYASSSTMDAATMPVLVNAGIFPGDTNPSGSTARNGWGGLITVAQATASVAGDAFYVSFAGVPKDACINMATANSGQGRDAGLIGVSLGTYANSTTLPFNATAASALCTGTSNTLVFTFRLKG